MRPVALALPLLLVGLSLCGGVGAATQKPKAAPTTASAIDGLRGPLDAAPSSSSPTVKPAAPARPISSVPAISLTGDQALGDSDKSQCRQACAHAYYFCSSNADSGDCPGNWSTCLADCSPSARPLPSAAE